MVIDRTALCEDRNKARRIKKMSFQSDKANVQNSLLGDSSS